MDEQNPLFQSYTKPGDQFGLQFFDINQQSGAGSPAPTDSVLGFWGRLRESFTNFWDNFPWDQAYLIYGIIIGVIIFLLLVFVIYHIYHIGLIREEGNKRLREEVKANLTARHTEPMHVNHRWEHVIRLTTSDNEGDWRYAIIEADSMLEDLLIRLDYEGKSLGERLSTVQPRHFRKIQQARIAHKVRNRIAHQSSEFHLAKGDADRTIKLYEEVFRDMGYI